MICEKCGVTIPEGNTVCEYCGEEVKKEEQAKVKNKYNILGLVSAIIVAIGVFLPAITMKVGDLVEKVALISGYGKIVLGLAVVFLILLLLGMEFLAVVPAIFSAILMIYKYVNESSVLDEFRDYGIHGGFAIGFYLCLFGSVIMVFSPFIWKFMIKNRKTNNQTEQADEDDPLENMVE